MQPKARLPPGSLATGDSIQSVEYTGGPVNVGTGTSTPSAAVIVDANGNDVTANYNITYSGAEVTVSKYSGEVVITAKDATKPYDGYATYRFQRRDRLWSARH